MRVLVVGSGAREHAISWKLTQSPEIDVLFVAPGNAGTSSIATNLPVDAENVSGLLEVVNTNNVDFTIVGPEAPLASGIVNIFRNEGLSVFGPTREAAQIETSKTFARGLMEKYGIPAPAYYVVDSYQEGVAWLNGHAGPVVVKADGLAGGKGVFVCSEQQQALHALQLCMVRRAFGSAGDRVLLEECLEGPEVSVFTFTDGHHISSLFAASDYKRAFDGNEGPNTGGMGSYSPPFCWNQELSERVKEEIMLPVVEAMRCESTPYVGVLYAGLILTSDGAKVVEFNCRLGDPESQVILPRLETDFLQIAEACVQGRLNEVPVEWTDAACVGVVIASRGYPEKYDSGFPINGLDSLDEDVMVFHAGTRLDKKGSVITSGGRVLTMVSMSDSIASARSRVYDNIGRIQYRNAYYRCDIGQEQQRI